MSIAPYATRAYVGVMRGVRLVADRTGLLGWLDEGAPRSARTHIRSLLAIHDVVDMARLDTPWWTYQAVEAVAQFLTGRQARVFEYGSGASTLWLAARAQEVHSVEHDPGFSVIVDQLLREHPRLRGRVHLHVVPAPTAADPLVPSSKPIARGMDFASYVAQIERVGGTFDLIVVDGRAREACVEVALRHLKPDGWIVLDDSQRRRYRRVMHDSGLHVQHFRGLAPATPYPRYTSILSRPLGRCRLCRR